MYWWKTYESITVPLQIFFLFQPPQQNQSQEEKNRASWLGTALFWKSLGQMVRFSIKPDDQTDETESPNLVNKTGL